jgi:hypothetical protein
MIVWFAVIWLLGGTLAKGSPSLPARTEGDEFRLSPPAVAPAKRDRGILVTNLRDLTDAHGLALLVRDDAAADKIRIVLKKWQHDYSSLLSSDTVLLELDKRMQALFGQMLGGESRSIAKIIKLLSTSSADEIHSITIKWLKGLLLRRDVLFRDDLKRLSKTDLADICLQAKAADTLKGLPSWRYRQLAWLVRDRRVKRFFNARDERLSLITPVRIRIDKLRPDTRAALQHYLAMVRNLKLQVLNNKSMPHDRYKTLAGLLRGLRYMPTIRLACEATGVDLYIITRLFIQESEFIHQRISWAGAFSLGQFLNIALEDVWIFKGRIPGAAVLLKGIGSLEEMKKKVVADPRMAIKVTCIYFRRLKDEVALRLGKKGRRASREMISLLTLENFLLRKGVGQSSLADSLAELNQAWPVGEMVMLPVVPLAGGMIPDTGAMLAGWLGRTVRDLVEIRLADEVFKRRLDRLHSALGLAAYNAGMSNLIKASKRRSPFGPISFPLQITETRNYVDDILDGRDILEGVTSLVSDVALMSYSDLIDLSETACRLAGKK